MHAAEIAAAIDPSNQDIRRGHLQAQFHVLDDQIQRGRTGKDKRFYSSLVATAREVVTDADNMMRSDRQNMVYLAALARSEFTLAEALQEGAEDGWKEAVQIGLIRLEKAENAAGNDEKDKDSPEIAGKARGVLADLREETHDAEEARKERLRAVADYRLALSRYPADVADATDKYVKKRIEDDIRDLETKLGKDSTATGVAAP
jgi:hypothetical protein